MATMMPKKKILKTSFVQLKILINYIQSFTDLVYLIKKYTFSYKISTIKQKWNLSNVNAINWKLTMCLQPIKLASVSFQNCFQLNSDPDLPR